MCNLFTQTHATEAMQQLFGARLGLAPGAPGATGGPVDIYPDGRAVLIRPSGEEGRDLVLDAGRWGMPTPALYLEGRRTDRGVTNVRNTGSAHWRRWLVPAHRCLVPFARFAEPGPGGGPVWFSTADGAPAFLAGITTVWTSVRKLSEGETTDRLFAFLTCPPNAEVGAVHPKAMPVVLTDPGDWETWLSAPWAVAGLLQRPLRDGGLRTMRGGA